MDDVLRLLLIQAIGAVGNAGLLDINFTDLCVVTVEDTSDLFESWAAAKV